MRSAQQCRAQDSEDNEHLCLGLLLPSQIHFLVRFQYNMTGYESLAYILKTYNAQQADKKVLSNGSSLWRKIRTMP